MSISVYPLTSTDTGWVKSIWIEHWGGEFVITRGKKYFADDVEGFYACDDRGNRVGLLTYRVTGDECEMISLDAFTRFGGIGTQLVDRLKLAMIARHCKRMWLITTNDNLEAIRFYQRRGFVLAKVHANALEQSRKLKPSIPAIGNFGIPLRDELEFEMWL